MRDFRITGIRAEAVLLVVCAAEDEVANALDDEDGGEAGFAEENREDGKIAGLKGVDERNPDEITEAEHVAKAVSSDVHGCQDGGFHVEAIEDVESLECGDEIDGDRPGAC